MASPPLQKYDRLESRLNCASNPILEKFIELEDLADIPAEVVQKAKWVILDTLGVGIAGTVDAASTKVLGIIDQFPMKPEESVLWGKPRRSSCLWAAMANSMSASCLDADDGHRKAMGHPAGVIVPTALAAAERSGSPGAQMLTAFVMGYELGVRAGIYFNRSADERFYGSGTWATMGAAAAASKLFGLSPQQCMNALGIAEVNTPISLLMKWIDVSRVPEIKEAMSWSAFTGMMSVLKAETGMRGHFSLNKGPEGDAIFSDLGSNYEIRNTYFKQYPSCRWTHPVIDAIRSAVADHGFKPEQVAHVDIRSHHRACSLTNEKPQISQQAQYSIPFLVGVALVHGVVEPQHIMGAALEDELVLSLANKVSITCSSELDAEFPRNTMASLLIRLVDGRKIFVPAKKITRGDSHDPLCQAEIFAKFRKFAGLCISDSHAEQILQIVMNLEHEKNVYRLTQLL